MQTLYRVAMTKICSSGVAGAFVITSAHKNSHIDRYDLYKCHSYCSNAASLAAVGLVSAPFLLSFLFVYSSV